MAVNGVVEVLVLVAAASTFLLRVSQKYFIGVGLHNHPIEFHSLRAYVLVGRINHFFEQRLAIKLPKVGNHIGLKNHEPLQRLQRNHLKFLSFLW